MAEKSLVWFSLTPCMEEALGAETLPHPGILLCSSESGRSARLFRFFASSTRGFGERVSLIKHLRIGRYNSSWRERFCEALPDAMTTRQSRKALPRRYLAAVDWSHHDGECARRIRKTRHATNQPRRAVIGGRESLFRAGAGGLQCSSQPCSNGTVSCHCFRSLEHSEPA